MHGIRQNFRTLWRDKGFTAVSIAMLALGIGATTAMFSVVSTVLLRSSYHDPERLFVIEELAPKFAEQSPTGVFPVNARHFDEWRKACSVCSGFGLLQGGGANLTGEGVPERVRTLGVSHDLLPTLGIAPSLGRSILSSDDEPGAPPVILLTDAFWRRRFQGDPALVGTDIRLYGRPVTVIGVLPPTFEFVGGGYLGEDGQLNLNQEYDAVRPLRLRYSEIRPMGNFFFGGVVRLKPGATPQQAVDQMNTAISGFSREFGFDMFVRLRPLDQAVLGNVATGLWMLLAAVGTVLLIVCVNLGNLMFVRADRRRREAAVRRALGATSIRLLGQVIREGIVLAFLGGAAGVLVAQWAIEALVLTAPANTPRLSEVRLDWTALAFGFIITAVAGLLTSLLPALRYGGGSAQDTLREAQAAATTSVRRMHLRSILVALEVALSTVLLIAAALMGTSFLRLMSVEKGFTAESVLSFDIELPYQIQERGRFHDQLLERLAALPGVNDVGFTNKIPLEGTAWGGHIIPEGATPTLHERPATNFRLVSSGYWRAMGIRLSAGRLLEPADRGRNVAVISEELSRKAWPGENPVGKRFLWGLTEVARYEVVGVVEDVRTSGLGEPAMPIAYLSFWTIPLQSGVSYAVRTEGDPAAFAAAIRETVWSIDSALPVTNLRTMEQVVRASAARERFLTTIAGLFAVTALLLAALGIYGVVSYIVSGRTNEIGLRMALGAETRSVLAMVLGQGMRPIFAGLVAGLAGAALLGRFTESLLFEVSARDPLVFGGVAALLIAVSLLACYVPARRAARIDPMIALRYE